MAVHYRLPRDWIGYDPRAIVAELTGAKAAVLSLASMPYRRAWAEALQEMELKREVAGTSRIEGADFTERELDVALQDEVAEDTLTRSQRQARAAKQTYRWIAALPGDRPIDEGLIKEVHRRIVTGCDDDHCEPGAVRGSGHNVTFGRPPHRGVEGGEECERAFSELCAALGREFRAHDPLVQALALHYHIGAMHPFQDGNGRTARAVEALILQRDRLKDDLFVSMSNYYYDEKPAYLAALSAAGAADHDLTAFLKFGLKGIERQCKRLLGEIRVHIEKTLFRDVMHQMYGRLKSTRKRVLAERQMKILAMLLDGGPMSFEELVKITDPYYARLRAPGKAFVRDLKYLIQLNAVDVDPNDLDAAFSVRLKWATEITETAFFEALKKLPTAKTPWAIS